jgi:hypothetical protein
VQLFKDAIVVNKSEPSQKEKEEVLTITVGGDSRGGYGGGNGGENRGGGNRGGY